MTFRLQIDRMFKLEVLVSLPVRRSTAVAMRTGFYRSILGPEQVPVIAQRSGIRTWLADGTHDQHGFAVARNFKSP